MLRTSHAQHNAEYSNINPRSYATNMGSAWSRKQATIDSAFEAAPRNVTAWDLQHVKLLHAKFRDDGYEFGIDRTALRDLLTSALPTTRALTEEFWDSHATKDQELLFPLELFATIVFQCHGLTRDKAAFFFDMFDFSEREEESYDEVAICIATVVGALTKVSSDCQLPDEAQVDKLADDAYVFAARDASAPLAKSDFLMWVEKGLKIDLAADLSIEDVGKALGVYAEHEKEQQPALDCTAVEG